MKSAFFLVLFELWAGMCLSNETAVVSGVETEQSIILNLWPFNDTDKLSPHNTVPDPSGEEFVPESSMRNFTEKNTNFGFNLYRKIALKHDNNVFFSPLSLSFALAAFLLASEGDTHHQMIETLNLHLLDDKENRLPSLFQQLSVSLTKNKEFTLLQDSFSFVQKGFQIKDVFRNLSKRYFDMEFLMVDFHNSTHAKNAINQHVKQKTRGKIPSLFDAVDHQARIILVNCILFKGNWLHPFPPMYTEPATFYIDSYRTVQVPMMSKTERVAITFDKSLSCVVLKLPYKGSAHMLIVIPEKGADFMSVEDHLTNELVESWLRTMNSRKMDIYFPKFKLDQKYHMHQLLQDLGIKDLFSNEADLSHLTNERDVKVSQVLQRAAIEVDEWGTEAVAASGSEIMAYSLPPVIRVNRPFLFMIYEASINALLFLGRVIDPTEL